MWKFRPFRNTDPPVLTKIWNSHYRSIDSNSVCPVSVWDICILSKPYFRADELILAIDPLGTPSGFIHFGFVGNRDLQGLSRDHAAIHQICVMPGPDEDVVASQLLEQAENSLRSRGAISCSGIGAGERSGFYLGVAEGDNLMGILAHDTRTQRWLAKAGFVPVRPTECWELELASFRPPMDRMQIQTRRTCSIARILDEDYEHWWTNAALGHCDQTRFHVMIKSPPSPGGTLTCWFPDPGILGLDPSVVRVILEDPPESEESRERFVYLAAESMRQLQLERKRLVRTVVSADKQRTVTLLHRLGFRSVAHGLLFEKQFQSDASAWR